MTETNSKSRRQYWQERAAAARKKGGVTEDLIKEYMMDQQQQFLSVLEEIGMLGKAGNLRKALRKIRRVVESALPEKNDQLISKALDHPLEYLVYPIFFAKECEGKRFYAGTASHWSWLPSVGRHPYGPGKNGRRL